MKFRTISFKRTVGNVTIGASARLEDWERNGTAPESALHTLQRWVDDEIKRAMADAPGPQP